MYNSICKDVAATHPLYLVGYMFSEAKRTLNSKELAISF